VLRLVITSDSELARSGCFERSKAIVRAFDIRSAACSGVLLKVLSRSSISVVCYFKVLVWICLVANVFLLLFRLYLIVIIYIQFCFNFDQPFLLY